MKKGLPLLLLVIAILGVTGCSSKNANNEAGATDKKEETVEIEKKDKTKEQKEPDTKPVSEAQYKSIENGMSKEEVVRKLGEPLKKEDKETSEWWYYDLKKEDRIIKLTISFMNDEVFATLTGSKDDDK